MKRFFQSLMHGAAGFRTAISERNMQIHLVATTLVVVLGFWCNLSLVEFAIIAICIGGVIAAECLNTAIERLADRVTQEQDSLIKQAKDVAAAGVLTMAIMSTVVGSLLLLPKVIAMVQ